LCKAIELTDFRKWSKVLLKSGYSSVDKKEQIPSKGVVRVITFLLIFGAVAVALAVLDFMASRYGRDSRDGYDWFSRNDLFEVGRR
jgi:hypothetical protein